MHCCVLNCKNSSVSRPDIVFYKFPKEPKLAITWLKMARNPELVGESTEKLENNRICSDHFDNNQFIDVAKQKLKWNAIPTIFNRPLLNKGTPESTVEDVGGNGQGDSSCNDNITSCLERELVNPHKLTLRDLRGDFSDFSTLTEYVYDSSEEHDSQSHDLRNLFWELQQSNEIQLSAKYSKLYVELQSKQMTVYKLLQKCRRQYKSIEGIRNICNSRSARHLERFLSPSAAFLFAEQFSSDKQSEGAQFWTNDEKIKALLINKESPKMYVILEKILALPPRNELRNLLKTFDISTGINNIMFQSLANRVKKIKSQKDRCCFLLFDEFVLEQGLHHQQGPDKIIGFEDLGIHGQSKMPANYALFFMLRGVKKNWHHPVAYYFCHKETPMIILRRILVEVIESIHEIGIKILAIVFDQAALNTSTLWSYISVESKGPYINVGGNKITTIFDSPSLLILFRDNFMKYNICWQGKVAKWNHLETLYVREKEEEYKLAEKLTENHLNPKESMSDRVNLAAQVLSHSTATAVYIYASTDAPGKTPLPWEALGTPKVISTMDRLFDSFNREPRTPKENKKMNCVIKHTSKHFKFWSEALEFINDWKFVEPGTDKVVRPAVQDGWINNIEGCLQLMETLQSENIYQLSLRRLNLDPLRKLFSSLKHTDRNPSCSQFVSDLKTFLLNEKVFKSQCYSNVDEDYLLLDIRQYCNIDQSGNSVEPQEERKVSADIPEIDTLWAWEEPQLAYFEAQSVLWVSAFLAKLAIEKFPCEKCKSCLVFEQENSSIEHFVIGEQALHLLNPKDELCWLVSSMVHFCERVLPNIVYEKGVVAKMTKISSERLEVQGLNKCPLHADEMISYLLSILSRINVHQFCRKYNRKFKNQK